MAVGAAVREDPDGGGRGAAGGRLAERAWEENSSEQRQVAFALSLSLLLIVDLDRSTIDRRTDPFDRSRHRSRSIMIVHHLWDLQPPSSSPHLPPAKRIMMMTMCDAWCNRLP